MPSYKEIISFWRRKTTCKAEDVSQEFKDFHILLAYHSEKLDNDEIDYINIQNVFEDNRLQDYTGSLKTLYNQYNHKLCYSFLKEKIEQKVPITLELIKRIHFIMTVDIFNQNEFFFKYKIFNTISEQNCNAKIEENFLLEKSTERALKQLLREVENYEGDNWLEIASYFHARFRTISPFETNSGRVNRVLLNYYLLIHDFPPLIIYKEDKNMYLSCLQRFNRYQNLKPLIRFFVYETEKTWAAECKKEKTEHRKKEGAFFSF